MCVRGRALMLREHTQSESSLVWIPSATGVCQSDAKGDDFPSCTAFTGCTAFTSCTACTMTRQCKHGIFKEFLAEFLGTFVLVVRALSSGTASVSVCTCGGRIFIKLYYLCYKALLRALLYKKKSCATVLDASKDEKKQ